MKKKIAIILKRWQKCCVGLCYGDASLVGVVEAVVTWAALRPRQTLGTGSELSAGLNACTASLVLWISVIARKKNDRVTTKEHLLRKNRYSLTLYTEGCHSVWFVCGKHQHLSSIVLLSKPVCYGLAAIVWLQNLITNTSRS